MELIETEQARLAGDDGRRRRDRIITFLMTEAGFAGVRIALAPLVNKPVDLSHKSVEVDAALLLHRRRSEEQVHQHGLAPTHRPIKINAARRFALFQERQREAGFVQGVEIALQPRQRLHRIGLTCIGRDLARLQLFAVGGGDGEGHWRGCSPIARIDARFDRPPPSARARIR